MLYRVERIFDKDGNMVIGDEKRPGIDPPTTSESYESAVVAFLNMFGDYARFPQINKNFFTRRDNKNNSDIRHYNVLLKDGIHNAVVEKRNMEVDGKPKDMLYSYFDYKTNKGNKRVISVPDEIAENCIGYTRLYHTNYFSLPQDSNGVVPKVGYDVGRSGGESAVGRQIIPMNPLQKMRKSRMNKGGPSNDEIIDHEEADSE